MEGFQLTRRASRIGFDWDSAEGVLEKLAEEAAELRSEVGAGYFFHREQGPAQMLHSLGFRR
jgi:uncharacterized protein YabN with tetrapyrrole methylase and pyrophosphatase domain